MIRIPLKSGKTIDVSSIDAILGTVWVKKIDYRQSDLSKEDKLRLRESVQEKSE